MIQTVLGKIKKSQLGVCSPHEHVFIDMRHCVDVKGNEAQVFYEKFSAEKRAEIFSNPYAILDNALLDNFDDALKELQYFKNAGGNSIIDCTLDEIGRDPLKLKELSILSGVNIIIGCGHYYHKAHYSYVKQASVEQLENEMLKDLNEGINGTQVKAGIIGEIGTSATITDDEKKVLIASGRVSAQTGKAIHVHTDLYTENGFEVVKILTEQGATPQKICIDHVDVLLRPDYVEKLLNLGVFVEFDNFGKEFYISADHRFAYDLERIKLLKRLIDQGFGDKILISNDICLKSMWEKYGGLGYSHILRTVKTMALENGITQKQYEDLLTTNVKNFI